MFSYPMKPSRINGNIKIRGSFSNASSIQQNDGDVALPMIFSPQAKKRINASTLLSPTQNLRETQFRRIY